MPSVMGLLEERERAARQRVEALQAELLEAEAAWERFVIARETVAEVLALPCGGEEGPPVVVAGEGSGRITTALPGSANRRKAITPDGPKPGGSWIRYSRQFPGLSFLRIPWSDAGGGEQRQAAEVGQGTVNFADPPGAWRYPEVPASS